MPRRARVEHQCKTPILLGTCATPCSAESFCPRHALFRRHHYCYDEVTTYGVASRTEFRMTTLAGAGLVWSHEGTRHALRAVLAMQRVRARRSVRSEAAGEMTVHRKTGPTKSAISSGQDGNACASSLAG